MGNQLLSWTVADLAAEAAPFDALACGVGDRRGSDGHRFTLDLHRAAALWFWFVLLALAVSSVHLGLSQTVFRPIVSLFSPLTPSLSEQGESRRRAAPVPPRLTLADAISAASSEAGARGWKLRQSGIFAFRFMGYIQRSPDAFGRR